MIKRHFQVLQRQAAQLRAPPPAASKPDRAPPESDCANRVEMDPDYLEELQREKQAEQLDLPGE
jgi:hypothetical protein